MTRPPLTAEQALLADIVEAWWAKGSADKIRNGDLGQNDIEAMAVITKAFAKRDAARDLAAKFGGDPS